MDTEAARTEPTTYNVLFVCTGNTCRSPMAEALATRELERRGWKNVRVRSAGVAANDGAPASRHAAEVAEETGLDLSRHRSAMLTSAAVDWADLILVMSPTQLAVLEELGAAHKSSLLGDFVAGAEGAGSPVPDPFGGDTSMYRTTFTELERLVSRALDRLTAIISP